MNPSDKTGAGVVRLGERSISDFRFHHMLVRFSADLERLDRMAKIEIDRAAAADAIAHITTALGLPPPVLSFSSRRKHADGTPTGTGVTVWSVEDLVTLHGRARVAAWQAAGLLAQHRPAERIVKLGDPTLLASTAHEVAHVQVAERWPGAPAHGRVFVGALDHTAAAAADWLDRRHPELTVR